MEGNQKEWHQTKWHGMEWNGMEWKAQNGIGWNGSQGGSGFANSNNCMPGCTKIAGCEGTWSKRMVCSVQLQRS